jgi:hypothetical protein
MLPGQKFFPLNCPAELQLIILMKWLSSLPDWTSEHLNSNLMVRCEEKILWIFIVVDGKENFLFRHNLLVIFFLLLHNKKKEQQH